MPNTLEVRVPVPQRSGDPERTLCLVGFAADVLETISCDTERWRVDPLDAGAMAMLLKRDKIATADAAVFHPRCWRPPWSTVSAPQSHPLHASASEAELSYFWLAPLPEQEQAAEDKLVEGCLAMFAPVRGIDRRIVVVFRPGKAAASMLERAFDRIFAPPPKVSEPSKPAETPTGLAAALAKVRPSATAVRLPGDRNPLLQSKVPATVWGLWPDAKGNPEAIVVEQGTGARLEIAVLPAVDDGNEIAEILAAVLGYIGLDGATAEKLEKLKAYATACCERAAEKAENVAPQAKKAQAAAEAAVAQAEKDLAGAAVAVPGPGRATGKARDPVVRAREKAARAKARVDAVARDVDAYHWFPVGSSLSLYTSYNDLVTASMAPGRHVLITGETGVGKEATARTLHAMTFSKHRPFVAMNCAGLTEHLADSQLFGYRKGAFNEAYEDRDGLVQEADGGTLFLDEIQALPPVVRQKLLRFLQDGTFHRLGEAVERQATVRVVAATNRTGYEKDDELRTSGFLARFTFTIKLPPLRHRRDDIDELIRHFVAEVKEDYRGQAKSGTCGTTAIPPGRLANLYPDTGTIADWRSRTWRHENIRGLKSAVVKWFYGKVRDAVLAGGLDVTPRETVNLSDEGLLAVLRKIDHDGVSSFAEAREYFPAYPDSGKRRYIDGGWKAVRQRINRMEESSTEAKTGKREARHLLGKLRARIPEQPSGSSETPPRGPRRHRRQRASGLTG